MTEFFTLLLLTFVVITGSCLLINSGKKRTAIPKKHGLTGMCHKTGGVTCASCRKAEKQTHTHSSNT